MDAAHARGDVSRARTSQRNHLPRTVSITYFDPKNRWPLHLSWSITVLAEALTKLAQLRGNSRGSLHWLQKKIGVCFDSRFSCQWPPALEVPAFGASGRQPVPESGWGSATKWASPCFNWGISCLCLITESSLHFLFECENWEWTAEKLEVRSDDGWVRCCCCDNYTWCTQTCWVSLMQRQCCLSCVQGTGAGDEVMVLVRHCEVSSTLKSLNASCLVIIYKGTYSIFHICILT